MDYSGEWKMFPLSCPTGLVLRADTGRCECPQLTLEDGSCADCDGDAGFVFHETLRKCVCQFGLTFQNGACVECEPGFNTDLMGNCVPCGAKRFRVPGERECRFCEAADPDIVVATECLPRPCAEDEFRDESGSCTRCAAGQRLLNRRCVECEAGSVSLGGRTPFCAQCSDESAPNDDRSMCV
ncbi:Growth factor receptor cysteine-rich [Gracilaria domingensis]|nr:Growth factor receptor cysteine-rich [Gracilaria domingensis]